jgi:hypothetical protein
MPLATENDYYRVPGKVDILFAMPSVYTDLFKLGESENGIVVRKQSMIGRVSGDRYGGNEGPPVETQFFGLSAEIPLDLSRWDPVQVKKFESFGGLLSVTAPGTVPLTSVGALLQRDRGIRLLLLCRRDNSLSINFPCTVWSSPMETGKGSKYAKCGFSVQANRAPEGYWFTDAVSKVWDEDLQGVPTGMLNA